MRNDTVVSMKNFKYFVNLNRAHGLLDIEIGKVTIKDQNGCANRTSIDDRDNELRTWLLVCRNHCSQHAVDSLQHVSRVTAVLNLRSFMLPPVRNHPVPQ